MALTVTAGNSGSVRSDCHVSLTLRESGGLTFQITSKVNALYGDSIQILFKDIFKFYGIRNAALELEDGGALPFVLAARLEAAIRQAIGTDKEYLLPERPGNRYTTSRDTDRVTRLYLPGNNPKLMINAGIYGANGIILDLEDSVAPDRKAEARLLVRNALRSIDFYGAERMVRINQLPAGLDDLQYVVPHGVNLILIPKCENAGQVIQTDQAIGELLGKRNDSIHLMPIIESAAGVIDAAEIATASANVVALAIGLEDYTADIGAQRTPGGRESFFARSMVVNAARAAGIQPIDSVFSEIDDMGILAEAVRESRSLGFSGMGCIHPRQIPVIQENFLPTEEEVVKARKIVLAWEKSEREGLGVVAVESKMIDAPVVKRALNLIRQAVHANRLPENWREVWE
jgi:citrate lyase subunit beta/citryl-CoA lyase